MTTTQPCLTNAVVWRANIAQSDTSTQRTFIQEALQEYVNEMCKDGLRTPQVIVSNLPQELAGRYIFAANSIQIPFIPDLSSTQYQSILRHEYEHARQYKAGYTGGYQGDDAQMARLSFAVYPAQTHTRNGKKLRPEYAYNFNELRALLAEAKWVHQHYNERMNAQPPNCFAQEKRDILATMEDVRARIRGRPNISQALDVNQYNVRRLRFGKFNAAFAMGDSKRHMARFMKHTGKRLIKDTMKELKVMEKVLKQDIKALEQMVGPRHIEDTIQEEQQAVENYTRQQGHEALIEAQVKGFDFVTAYPTERAYSIIEVDSPRLLNYYLQQFPSQAQNMPQYHGSLHVMELPANKYKVFVPKELADEPNLDTTKINRDHIQEKQGEFEFDTAGLGELEECVL